MAMCELKVFLFSFFFNHLLPEALQFSLFTQIISGLGDILNKIIGMILKLILIKFNFYMNRG